MWGTRKAHFADGTPDASALKRLSMTPALVYRFSVALWLCGEKEIPNVWAVRTGARSFDSDADLYSASSLRMTAVVDTDVASAES